MKKFRMTVSEGTTPGFDPLGGAVTQGNAAFVTMSTYVEGPDLGDLEVGEHQIREACTGDGYYYPDTRGIRAANKGGSGPGGHTSHRKRIRYRVERVS